MNAAPKRWFDQSPSRYNYTQSFPALPGSPEQAQPTRAGSLRATQLVERNQNTELSLQQLCPRPVGGIVVAVVVVGRGQPAQDKRLLKMDKVYVGDYYTDKDGVLRKSSDVPRLSI